MRVNLYLDFQTRKFLVEESKRIGSDGKTRSMSQIIKEIIKEEIKRRSNGKPTS